MRALLLTLVVVLAMTAPAGTVRGQPVASAQSQYITPDARSQGMGRAFTAVAEGAYAAWWNPGALGIGDQITLSFPSYAQLVPDLADDVRFWGGGGAVSTHGFGVGASVSRLDYGKSTAITDEEVVLGEFESEEYTIVAGAGVDLGRVLDLENTSLGVGGNVKYFDVDLAPDWATPEGVGAARDDAVDLDLGALAVLRLPLSLSENGDSSLGIRGGVVLRNALDGEMSFIDEGQASPFGQSVRIGIAGDVGLLDRPPFGPTVRGLASAEAFLFTGKIGDAQEIYHYGLELTFLGIVSLRGGYIDDEEGTVEDWTGGAGVGVDLTDPAIGGRFDYASVPQSKYLDERVDHFTLSSWFKFR